MPTDALLPQQFSDLSWPCDDVVFTFLQANLSYFYAKAFKAKGIALNSKTVTEPSTPNKLRSYQRAVSI